MMALQDGTWTIQHTMVPYVISPTREFSGSRLRLMMRDSLRAAKLSSS